MRRPTDLATSVLRDAAPVVALLALLVTGAASLAAGPYEYTVLDDFEDVSRWIKGDPTTDMSQREVGYAPSTRFLKEGKQSLAFMVRVDWSEKPGQKYAKGWPMLSRTFDEPQDWSSYDRLELWIYTETTAQLPNPALRCGIGTPEGKPGRWHDLALKPNAWTRVSILLDEDRDWTRVTGVWFYLAEAWYHDGDRVNFYLDDLRLARRLTPAFLSVSATARTHPRATAVDITVAVEGPVAGTRLRARLARDKANKTEASRSFPLTAKRCSLMLPIEGATPGPHTLQLALADAAGRIHDRADLHLRVMQRGKRAYVNLVTFYTPHLADFKPEQMKVLNGSAYDGVAVPLAGAYDTAPVPDFSAYAAQIAAVKKNCHYHVWPWVFSNRLIGRPPDARAHSGLGKKAPEYFRRIKALDLDDAAGARSDFLKLWRNAVRLARELGSPGIVVDLEAYNDYRTYHLPYVAEQRGQTVGQVARECEALGADMARIVAEEYPRCVVWSLFGRLVPTKLTAPDYDGPLYPVPGHITLGFLKYCKQHHLPAKYLAGGEVGVGYYHRDPVALKASISRRDTNYAPVLAEFPDNLFLAGTISPYHDWRILTSWIKRNAGDNPVLKTIEDFRPMFKTLFDAYDWVWIYASSAGKTQPYNPELTRRYSAVIKAALDESAR